MRKSIFVLGLCSLFCFAGCGKTDKPIEQNEDNNEQTNKVDTEGKAPMVFVLAGQSNMEGNTQFDDGQGYLASALEELGIDDADCCYEGIKEVQTSFYGGPAFNMNNTRGSNTDDKMAGKFLDTKLGMGFSVILIATIVVWFLKSFDFSFNLVENSYESILAAVSGLLVPVMRPVGLGDWRIVTSLISGFMAKESVVSVMETLFPEGAASIGALSAASMLVFSLLYTPCVAAVAAIKRELGGKWAVYVVLWQCAVAWFAAFLVQIIGGML